MSILSPELHAPSRSEPILAVDPKRLETIQTPYQDFNRLSRASGDFGDPAPSGEASIPLLLFFQSAKMAGLGAYARLQPTHGAVLRIDRRGALRHVFPLLLYFSASARRAAAVEGNLLHGYDARTHGAFSDARGAKGGGAAQRRRDHRLLHAGDAQSPSGYFWRSRCFRICGSSAFCAIRLSALFRTGGGIRSVS